MNDRPTALVVVAHHRPDSLTAHIAGRVVARLEAGGYGVDVLDLREEGFDPRMSVADEPDWGDRDKVYSSRTRAHMERVLAADAIVPVFPVYWQSVPALLKGWIDRVWNYGFAYGRSKPRLAGKRMLWMGLAGAVEDEEFSPIMRANMEATLRDGISFYCGVTEAAVEILWDVEARPQRVDDEGNLVVGDEREDAEAHYAELDRRAADGVAKFLSLP